MLGVYSWDSTDTERSGIALRNQTLYQKYRRAWKDVLLSAPQDHPIHENLQRIEKDVIRTDRNHPFYPQSEEQDGSSAAELIEKNPELNKLQNILMTYTTSFPSGEAGFVQGMADLASVFLITMENESESFWCFSRFMDRVKSNFYTDGSGIKRQLDLLRSLIRVLDQPLYTKLAKIEALSLFCSFRWILVLFRREFEFCQSQKLWDVLLTDYYSRVPHVCMSCHFRASPELHHQTY